MPYKDEYGIWRHDKPQLVSAEVRPVHRWRFVLCKQERFYCDLCGEKLAIDDGDDEDFDDELAAQYGVEDWDWDDEFSCLFSYVLDYPYCPECHSVYDGGRAYYYNPRKRCFDLPAPLTRTEAAEMERLEREAAGQLALFPKLLIQRGDHANR